MSKKILALAAAGLIAVALAACGGDDGDDTSATSETTATAISEDDFVAQGNDICAAGNEELDAGPEDGDLDAYVTDTLVPNIQDQIDEIGALGSPEGMEDDVASFLSDAQTALDDLEANPGSISNDTFADVNKQAIALGLDECAG